MGSTIVSQVRVPANQPTVSTQAVGSAVTMSVQFAPPTGPAFVFDRELSEPELREAECLMVSAIDNGVTPEIAKRVVEMGGIYTA
jgi:hypothetical protein